MNVKRRSIYKIVRFFALILSVFCAFISMSVNAFAFATPSSVTSPMTEPSCSQTLVDGSYITVVPFVTYSTTNIYNISGLHYLLQVITFVSSSPLNLCFTTGRVYGDVSFSVSSVKGYDIESGNLVHDGVVYRDVWNVPGRVPGYPYEWYNHPQAQWTVPDSFAEYVVSPASYITSNFAFAEPFVTWAVDVPEQTQYRSSMPEPLWDTHNRYVVINDKLFWISFYLDNLWVNPVTGSPVIRDDDLTAVISGTASDPNDGDLYYNYNMSVTYQDKEYYCVQYNSIDYSFEDMCCPALIYNSSGSRLTFSFDQLSSIYSSIQDILIDYRIYCSSFDLVTGEYIESVYSAQGQVGNAEININISCPDTIESIYCYGVDFVNLQNLPVNLASVLWSYDLDFASWRTDISSKLDAIYQLLSQSETPSTTAPKDYGTAVSEVSDLPTYNASDVAGVLNSAVSDVNANLSSGIEWGQGWFARIYQDIPELFIVVVLALAFGLTLLILGKKKSDS